MLCVNYICVPNIDELRIWRFQLELGEFAPGLESLEFVSGECSSIYDSSENNLHYSWIMENLKESLSIGLLIINISSSDTNWKLLS